MPPVRRKGKGAEVKITINEIERDAILAGLRLLQGHEFSLGNEKDVAVLQICTNDGRHAAIMPEQIDRLCERINK